MAERKHKECRTILALNALVRRSLALHASLHGTDLVGLNDLDVVVQRLELSSQDRLHLTQLGWISVVSIKEHEVVATGMSRPTEGYDS
jgi:hypothetical protein